MWLFADLLRSRMAKWYTKPTLDSWHEGIVRFPMKIGDVKQAKEGVCFWYNHQSWLMVSTIYSPCILLNWPITTCTDDNFADGGSTTVQPVFKGLISDHWARTCETNPRKSHCRYLLGVAWYDSGNIISKWAQKREFSISMVDYLLVP